MSNMIRQIMALFDEFATEDARRAEVAIAVCVSWQSTGGSNSANTNHPCNTLPRASGVEGEKKGLRGYWKW
jgi:hypothetical protein